MANFVPSPAATSKFWKIEGLARVKIAFLQGTVKSRSRPHLKKRAHHEQKTSAFMLKTSPPEDRSV
jgi:hypothetical protein